MLGVNDYINNDQSSVSSEETYYSNEAVSNEYEDEYEEEYGYYEDGNGYMEEVIPYVSKTIPEKPKVTVNTKVPEVNPWFKNQGENATKKKSFTEIMEEEQKLEEQRKKKEKEEQERRARFKRKKIFNFRNMKQDKPNGSLLLKNRELQKNGNKQSHLLSKE